MSKRIATMHDSVRSGFSVDEAARQLGVKNKEDIERARDLLRYMLAQPFPVEVANV